MEEIIVVSGSPCGPIDVMGEDSHLEEIPGTFTRGLQDAEANVPDLGDASRYVKRPGRVGSAHMVQIDRRNSGITIWAWQAPENSPCEREFRGL